MSAPEQADAAQADAARSDAARSDADVADGDGDGEQAAPKTPMRRSSKIAIIVIVLVALAAAIGFTVSYLVDASHYVTTDNAQVDGTQIPITAPTSGTLTGWTGTQGAVLRADQVVGRVEIDGGYVKPQRSIRSPAAGTVAVDNTTEGAYVQAGTQLAVAYDPRDVYVTARVEETYIDDVRVGQRVEFTVDAYGGRTFAGSVREIQNGAANVFSPLPQSNSSGNFQKVTQVIPVKVSIDDAQGLELIPGSNVEVNIRID